jgi:hypothetical protein
MTSSANGTEYADVTDHAIDTITCVCGNSCSDEGMPQCNENGVVFHLLVGEAPEGLAEMPDDVEKLYTLCRSCGRVYHDQTTVRTNTAPVVKVVDVKAGPVAESLRLHDELEG